MCVCMYVCTTKYVRMYVCMHVLIARISYYTALYRQRWRRPHLHALYLETSGLRCHLLWLSRSYTTAVRPRNFLLCLSLVSPKPESRDTA